MNANQHKAMAWVGEADFELAVLRSKQPVLVTFWAPWSRPCHIIDSVLDEVATACAGSVKVVKVNADNHPALSLLYEIQSIPTLLYIVTESSGKKWWGPPARKPSFPNCSRSPLNSPFLSQPPGASTPTQATTNRTHYEIFDAHRYDGRAIAASGQSSRKVQSQRADDANRSPWKLALAVVALIVGAAAGVGYYSGSSPLLSPPTMLPLKDT